MPVSVILVAYHGDRWLAPCLETLARASRERLHLVLVDNSGNTTIDALDLSAYDAEVLRTPHPMGFADANNFALVEASRIEPVVLFLNQDTISPAGWIDGCLDLLASDDRLGAVSPVIRTYDDDGWDPSFLDCIRYPEQRAALEQAHARIDAEHAPAPALLVRTEALLEAGPFDPVFGSYYEDYDLCRRLRACRWGIAFAGRARVQHFSGSTTTTPERERRRMRQILRNRLLYQARESQRRARLVAGWFALDLPRRLARGLARTPSSQPPAVVLRAAADLLGLAPRLFSRRADERRWHAYLDALGWPSAVSTSSQRPTPTLS